MIVRHLHELFVYTPFCNSATGYNKIIISDKVCIRYNIKVKKYLNSMIVRDLHGLFAYTLFCNSATSYNKIIISNKARIRYNIKVKNTLTELQ